MRGGIAATLAVLAASPSVAGTDSVRDAVAADGFSHVAVRSLPGGPYVTDTIIAVAYRSTAENDVNYRLEAQRIIATVWRTAPCWIAKVQVSSSTAITSGAVPAAQQVLPPVVEMTAADLRSAYGAQDPARANEGLCTAVEADVAHASFASQWPRDVGLAGGGLAVGAAGMWGVERLRRRRDGVSAQASDGDGSDDVVLESPARAPGVVIPVQRHPYGGGTLEGPTPDVPGPVSRGGTR